MPEMGVDVGFAHPQEESSKNRRRGSGDAPEEIAAKGDGRRTRLRKMLRKARRRFRGISMVNPRRNDLAVPQINDPAGDLP